MELGVSELSLRYYSYQTTLNGQHNTTSGSWSLDTVCKNFVCAEYDNNISPDRFMKERLSLIELAFREKGGEIIKINANFPMALLAAKTHDANRKKRLGSQGNRAEYAQSSNDKLNLDFSNSVHELNERFRQAGYKLNYHNGFIQISEDELIATQIEDSFWSITKDATWKNVDMDMKNAIDLRDDGGRDPSFYAARALESAIKIISDQKGWTHGGERGAHSYLDNLGSKENGYFISVWEQKALKDFFTAVRNPFGHGAGSDDMPQLTKQQTDWAIETCMSWVKTLVKRS